ncbi:MAG: 50S ribosomal protein L4 [Desulfobacterales bacterium]
MAVVDVIDTKAVKVSEVELDDTIFNVPVKKSVLHEIVSMQLAKRRKGTATVKNRSDVRGSTRKLFRQKGTGRARRGSIKDPLLRGGGVIFGPQQRSYAYNVPKKVRKLGLKMALSDKLQTDKLRILDSLNLDVIKTKAVVEVLDALKIKKVLLITPKMDDKLIRSSRNLPGVKVLPPEGLNVYDLLKYDNLVLLAPAVEKIEGRLR